MRKRLSYNLAMRTTPSRPFSSGALSVALALSTACVHKPRGETAATSAPSERQTADLILFNGDIETLDPKVPKASAVAAKDGLILAVGSDAEILRYGGDATRRIDLDGQFATPGFIEGHGHYMSFGRSLSELELRFAKRWDEIVRMVADAAKKASPGEWIVGRGWHQSKWDRPPSPNVEGVPVHGALSAVSPSNPVMLVHTSGHGVFANARALQIAGIGPTTEPPPGGEILKDADGQPTGMLREAAQDAVRTALANHLAQRSPAEIEAWRRRHARLAAEASLQKGITSFQDMGVSFEELDLLRKMAAEGALAVRLYMAIDEPSAVMAEKLSAYRMIDYGGGFLTVRAIGEKVLDGALGTHGGWLLEPYSDLPRSRGLNVVPVDEIRASAQLAVQHDFQMAIQGIGDRAVRELLDLYENAFKTGPPDKDWRWRIEHAQVVHPDDLPRFVGLRVIPSVQGIFACSDGLWVEDRLGPERTRARSYLYRTMLESGALVLNGTDPPVEDIDPIASFDCTVTRRLTDGRVFQPEQRLTRMQALRSYTINNAYAAFEDHVKGTITPGKYADITVFDRNLLTVSDEALPKTAVVYTIVGGAVAYQRPAPP